ncbi:hypothetical protein F4677DRAFT_429425 [Hypoxylon crocopeplum]|nr:hypothetical protein F4677DRAFT_429425 [Hypoxylon crocopeplum]
MMPSMVPLATAMLLLASGIQAHFTLQHPAVAGAFDDDKEPESPCGGYLPHISSVPLTDFHVDGDIIATTLTHPQGNWLYRITTDPEAKGNWSQIYPIFQQSGIGTYCSPHVTVDRALIGQKAFLGIVSSAVDGLLYQCAGVNLIEGTGTAPSDCQNGSGVSTSYTADSALTSQLGNPNITTGETAASGGILSKGGAFQGLSAMVTVGVMVVLGAALMV